MNDRQWQKLNKIFEAASKIKDPPERREFVRRACAGDREILNEVESMLEYAGESNFLDEPVAGEVLEGFLEPAGAREDTPTRVQKSETQKPVHLTADSVDSIDLAAGTVLAERYRIFGLLGKGGMGDVYKAEDLKLDQWVALKFLPENLAKNDDARRRFFGEVKIARRVSHENVCRVFDIGETGGRSFISMEYVDGDDLAHLLRRIGRLPSDKAVEIARQICFGLNAIHKAGILHRDLKPSNIIIDSKGLARITDFGIAGFEADLQGAESRVGTPDYMAPEQLAGREVTSKSDIFSLGLVLYEIFTGRQAFEADSVKDFIRVQQTTNPTNPSEIVGHLDPSVEKIINRCLAKNPSERPSTALRVAAALPGGNPLQIALEAGETPTPEMVAAAPKKGVLKLPVAFSLLAVFVGLLAAVMYFASEYQSHAFAPLEKSPEVLEERAKNVLRKTGHASAPGDFESGFGYENGYIRFVRETKNFSVYDFEKLKSGQPSAVYFWYRQSPGRLMPISIIRNVITEFDPPLNEPETKYVKLDARGRLVELIAVPAKSRPLETENRLNWKILFEEAGLDFEKFKLTDARVTPPVFAEEQIAWRGTLADFENIPIRVEAAAAYGKPVYFEIFAPWQNEFSGKTGGSESAFQIRRIIFFLFNFLTFFGALVISYFNLKAGRGDLRGAAKLSVFFFVLIFIHRLVSYDYDSILNHWLTIFFIICGQTVILFLLYAAIEPFVRRWWAEMLISWNRLLAGDFTNPLIGRDVLVGGLLGFVLVLPEYLGGFLRDFFASANLTIVSFQTPTLEGTQPVVTAVLLLILVAIIRALLILMMFVILYLVFRKKWLATLIVGLFAVGIFGFPQLPSRGWIYILFLLFIYVPVVFLYIRFGLLTIISSLIFYQLAGIAVTFDHSRFYFSNTILVAAIGLAVALCAFYISTGRRKIFEERILK